MVSSAEHLVKVCGKKLLHHSLIKVGVLGFGGGGWFWVGCFGGESVLHPEKHYFSELRERQ